MADRCSFCGSTAGPFSKVEGLFTVLMCADCQAARGHGSGPYPVMTRAEMRAGLDLLPTWALEQKAAANRQVIAVMRRRLAAGEQVARMYQEPGLAWLERQAEVAEDLVAERQAAAKRHRLPGGSCCMVEFLPDRGLLVGREGAADLRQHLGRGDRVRPPVGVGQQRRPASGAGGCG